jgi:hypothetical protein
MPPSQIFLSTRTRRHYPGRRAGAQGVPVSVLLVIVLFLWVLAAVMLWSEVL